jgi:Fe-S-cluster containining protein
MGLSSAATNALIHATLGPEDIMDTRSLLRELPSRSAARRKDHKAALKQIKKLRAGEIENLMEELHRQAFEQIDCLECGNCCRNLGPRIIDRDVQRISKFLRIKPAAFYDSYLTQDEDNHWVFPSMPCPFLGEDNYCSVYEVRPKACAEYPHTEGRQVRSRLSQLIPNASICPAVFLILDELVART